jgi:peptidoglycan/xylan/chitin deacetylase (PgdA/CDA1 family)
MLRFFILAMGLLLAFQAQAAGPKGQRLVEPRLTVPSMSHQQRRLALTLDACSGRADTRILSALITNRIPATIFVTARWLARNPQALARVLAHPDLFEIENHGARHLPAVDYPTTVFGLRAAGSPEAVRHEIGDGAAAILAATGQAPLWYRGATGKYSASALTLIWQSGEAVAGYSLIADDGAQLSASGVRHRLMRARDGDVIIAHVNHPEKPAGAGLIDGILALKAKGFVFVKLGTPRRLPHHRGS